MRAAKRSTCATFAAKALLLWKDLFDDKLADIGEKRGVVVAVDIQPDRARKV